MINYNDILLAQKRIAQVAKVTPLLTSHQLSSHCGAPIFLKSEHLQTTGAFKIRGAMNSVTVAAEEGATHITAASSGNHGQAVALAAQKLNLPATIVVPTNAARCKVAAIEAYGGIVEYCGTTSEERIPRAIEIAKEKGGRFIPPYDDPYVAAGQGTIGLEILEQCPNLSTVIVPIGGGGLISGILTAIKAHHPHVRVIGVEPESGNDTALSLQKGERLLIPPTESIADGLRTARPGELTFPIVQKYLDEILLVSEEEIRTAFSFVLERMKQLIEPSSATTIAALMYKKVELDGGNCVAVISGGNVDIAEIPNLTRELSQW